MTTPTAYRRSILKYLKHDYGVTDAEVHTTPHGGHRRVRFTYKDRPYALTIHDHQNNLGGHALSMKLQDIRRTLGPPPSHPASPSKPTRAASIEEGRIVETSPATEVEDTVVALIPGEVNYKVNTFRGTCALTTPNSSTNARLKFTAPAALFSAFAHAGACAISRLDEETFTIKPRPGGFKTPRWFMDPSTGNFALLSEKVVQRGPDTVPWWTIPSWRAARPIRDARQ